MYDCGRITGVDKALKRTVGCLYIDREGLQAEKILLYGMTEDHL